MKTCSRCSCEVANDNVGWIYVGGRDPVYWCSRCANVLKLGKSEKNTPVMPDFDESLVAPKGPTDEEIKQANAALAADAETKKAKLKAKVAAAQKMAKAKAKAKGKRTARIAA